ncbi:MAG TPA: DUF3088 family protein [Hellea balneolensis]|uniref:DUF3088 family protein n=1 Tax=Hellea balneolensis TaxID=287478 RepID=A0A7C5R7G8_9PROT|nr:DUF3088 family protein [Hellea balneolensis]
MSKPVLFLLAPGFIGDNRREYCPECAELWGVLSYFPAILQALDISYQPINRPRPDMVKILGADNQNCPTLLFPKDYELVGDSPFSEVNGRIFINNARDIGVYFSHAYGTPWPRGH